MAAVRTIRVAAITAGGPTQDVTISGFGTPTAVVVEYVKATTDDVVVNDAAQGAGLYDGVSPVCCFSHSRNNLASSSGGRGNDFSYNWFIRSFDASASDDARASVSFITDGIRLNWDLLPPAGWLMTFTFFTGTELEYCDYVDNSGGDVDVTTAGGQPNFILTVGPDTGSFPSANFEIVKGFCVEDGGVVTQGSMTWWEQNNSSNCSPMVTFDTSASKRVMFGGGLIGGIQWKDFDANGATAGQVAAAGCKTIYLMLKFPAAQKVGVFSSSVPTSTGTITVGHGGAEVPSFMQCCFAALTPAMDNTWRGSSGDPEAGVVGSSYFDDSVQICNTLFLDESTDPVVTNSVSRSGSVFDSADDNQANAWVGTATGFVAGGMSVNITAAPATERRIFGWYLEEEAGGGGDTVDVEGVCAGISAVGASLLLTLRPSSSIDASSDVSAALAVSRELASSVAGASVVTGSLLALREALSQIDSTSSVAGSLSRTRTLGLQSDGSSAVTSALEVAWALASQVDGLSAVTASLLALRNQNAQADGSSAVAGTLIALRELISQFDGGSAVSANLSTSQSLASQVDAASQVAASLHLIRGLAASADGSSTVDPTLNVLFSLASAVDGVSSVSATLEAAGSFEAQSDGSSAVAGALRVLYQLSTSVLGTSAVEGDALLTRGLQAQIDSASAVAATLSRTRFPSGQADGISTVTGALNLLAGLAAQTDGVSAVAAELDVSTPAALGALIDGTASVGAALRMLYGANAAVLGASGVTGDVRLLAAIAASSAGASAVGANLNVDELGQLRELLASSRGRARVAGALVVIKILTNHILFNDPRFRTRAVKK